MPLVFHDQGVDEFILSEHFGLEVGQPDLSGWEAITRRAAAARRKARIALVGKYVQLEDAYLSVAEALRHAGVHHDAVVEVDWVDSETVGDPDVTERLHRADGILIPGGFGGRGWEGKITAARIARTKQIPYLGICLGMHVAVSEFARHVAGMEGANSTEMDLETPFPVIDLLPEQKEIADMGGTMRLGADPVKLHDGTRIRELYGEAVVYERHRHRYEVNNHLRKRLESAGLVCSGTSPDERLVEAVELPTDAHPFYVASQYHPEFKSRPERPAPLFREFVGAALATAEAGAGRRSRHPPRSPRRPGPSATSPSRAPPPRDPLPGPGRPRVMVRRATDAERERLHETFAALCRIESPSGHERRVADWLTARAAGHGLEVDEDASGPAAGSDAGNLLARIPGTGPGSVLMCAHMDTVPLAAPVEPVLVDGGWENANDGILGADNKSAIAVILELARRVTASGEAPPVGHRDPVHRL